MSATKRRSHGQGPQDFADWLWALVALDGADQALEHAAVEGQAQGRRAEDERDGDRLETEVVDGELGEERPLERVEAEDDEGRDHDASRLRAQRAPRHRQELERMQLVADRTAAGRDGARHAGMNPSPTKSNRRRSGSKGVVVPVEPVVPDGHHGPLGRFEGQLGESRGGEVGPDGRRRVGRTAVTRSRRRETPAGRTTATPRWSQ